MKIHNFYFNKDDIYYKRKSLVLKPDAKGCPLPPNTIVEEFADSYIDDDEGKEVKSLYHLAVINGEVYFEGGWVGFRPLTSKEVRNYKNVKSFALKHGVKPAMVD